MAKAQQGKKSPEICVLLDNIRSVHNVGSIFRTSEAAGVSHIYCAQTTPTPNDRFGRKRKDFAKVALGAEDLVPWSHVENPIQHLKDLKRNGYKIIAVEQAENSVNYQNIELSNKNILIFGNEVEGVSSSLLKLADVVAEIPLKGKKESLNVAVTVGVALFGIMC